MPESESGDLNAMDRRRATMEKKWIGCAAPNFQAGRSSGHKPEAIVIHIMDGTLAGTDGWFNNPIARYPPTMVLGSRARYTSTSRRRTRRSTRALS